LGLLWAEEIAPISTSVNPEVKPVTESLVIEADYISYVSSNQYVEATGNVVVVYRDLTLTTGQSTINMQKEELTAGSGFIMNRGRQQISGEGLEYDFQHRMGTASSVNMQLMNKTVRGKKVEIANDRITIFNSQQTACPKEKDFCNMVTSKRLTIYPEWGDVVHDSATVYFFFVPIMWVPSYVADASGQNDLMYSAIPKFGANPVEGNFAKAGISYYTNEKLNGTIDVHYLSKLGARVGFTNNYKLDQSNRGQFRLHYLTGLGGRLSYGWQHRILFGVPHKDRQQIIDDFFRGIMPPSNDSYPEFVVDATSREMVGYQWVSNKPKLGLYSPAYEIFSTGLFHRVGGYVADILEEDIQYIPGVDFEEGNRQYVQTAWDYTIYRPFELNGWGLLTPGVKYFKSAYFSGRELAGAWRQLYSYADYTKSWQKWNLQLGYKKTASESGYSLFNSESFYAGTAEESYYGVGYQVLDNLKLDYTQQYSITDHKVRDRVYGVEWGVCCWKIRFGWSAYLSQFTFGVGLE
jgi:lipopolysaccharide assembly outer membrane protein LptD (OstA)